MSRSSSPDLETWHTPRLSLQRLEESHLAGLRRMDADESVMEMLGGVRSEVETRAYVQEQVQHWITHGFGWWAVFERASGDFVGRGGIRRIELEGRDEVEVGYALLPAYWGRGLATELACAGAAAAFDVLGLERLVAITLPANAASQRVLEKIGLQRAGLVRHKGLEHMLFETTRSDWLALPTSARPSNPGTGDRRASALRARSSARSFRTCRP